MSAAGVPWCVPCGNTGLSKHGDPRVSALPPPPPLNENLTCEDKGGGGEAQQKVPTSE